MPAFHPHIRAVAVGAPALALVSIAVGGTVAASNPPTLYACFDNYGNVRMSTSNTCLLPGGGRLASWGTAAVPGPVGAIGPAGATGSTGPTGPASTMYDGQTTQPRTAGFVGRESLTGICPIVGASVGQPIAARTIFTSTDPSDYAKVVLVSSGADQSVFPNAWPVDRYASAPLTGASTWTVRVTCQMPPA